MSPLSVFSFIVVVTPPNNSRSHEGQFILGSQMWDSKAILFQVDLEKFYKKTWQITIFLNVLSSIWYVFSPKMFGSLILV